MLISALPSAIASAHCVPADVTAFVARVLLSCLDVRSVWSMDHCPGEHWTDARQHELLAFADRTTLAHLRKCEDLRCADVELLVVVDGDGFESAWGPRRVSGSLARWSWRQVSAHEAYYDESRWAGRPSDEGSVVRVRRKALLIWQAPLSVTQ
jgi:hypothetical protein